MSQDNRERHRFRQDSWTAEEQAYAIKRRQEGATASRVAEDLTKAFGGHRSKNAVVGFFSRNGIPLPENLSPAQLRALRTVEARKAAAARREQMVEAIRDPKLATKKKSDFAMRADIAVEACGGPAAIRLRDPIHGCNWPIGAPKEEGFRFCDGVAADGKPYCKAHCEVAYVPRGKAYYW
jgi:GcrA cell cycle regulator